MLQDEAMSMSNEQAIQILKPMRDMMRDQHGCPISDEYFAVDKAIHALQTISPDEVRGLGKWEKDSDGLDVCSECGEVALQRVFIKLPDKIVNLHMVRSKFCPSCGARMGGVQDALP